MRFPVRSRSVDFYTETYGGVGTLGLILLPSFDSRTANLPTDAEHGEFRPHVCKETAEQAAQQHILSKRLPWLTKCHAIIEAQTQERTGGRTSFF